MRKHNLYVIPRSEAECNQLQSFVSSHGFINNYESTTFKVNQVAWFWRDKLFTYKYIGRSDLICLGEQVTPNELATRFKG